MMIAMEEGPMADTRISTDSSAWLLQAKDFLHQARRLKPGARRNELREVAKVLHELAKLEARSGFPDRLKGPDRPRPDPLFSRAR
jgi:hypothetical protein